MNRMSIDMQEGLPHANVTSHGSFIEVKVSKQNLVLIFVVENDLYFALELKSIL